MGDTSRQASLAGGVECPGRSVRLWKNVFGSLLICSTAMREVCREFGISHKTGYKIFDRYKAHGLEALSDARGVRALRQLPEQIEGLILRCKHEKPHIAASSQQIENYCNRRFVVETIQDQFFPQSDSPIKIEASGVDPIQFTCWPIISILSVIENPNALPAPAPLVSGVDFLSDIEHGQLTRLD
jgi:transposase